MSLKVLIMKFNPAVALIINHHELSTNILL